MPREVWLRIKINRIPYQSSQAPYQHAIGCSIAIDQGSCWGPRARKCLIWKSTDVTGIVAVWPLKDIWRFDDSSLVCMESHTKPSVLAPYPARPVMRNRCGKYSISRSNSSEYLAHQDSPSSSLWWRITLTLRWAGICNRHLHSWPESTIWDINTVYIAGHHNALTSRYLNQVSEWTLKRP